MYINTQEQNFPNKRKSTKMYTTFTNGSQKCSQNLHNISRERKTCSLGAPKTKLPEVIAFAVWSGVEGEK